MSEIISKVQFPVFSDQNGSLSYFESIEIRGLPIDIARVFTVKAGINNIRGQHAHYRCAQYLICLAGRVQVELFDGIKTDIVILDKFAEGIMIPAGIWSSQKYLEDESILMVLCDKKYDAEDYIRNMDLYITYVQGKL